MAVSIDIKKELKALIDNENDTSILQAIKTLLLKTNLDGELKEKLTGRALQSEQDITAKRLFNKNEAVNRLKEE